MNILYIVIIIVTAFAGVSLSVAGFAGAFVVAAGILLCALLDGFQRVGYLPVIIFFVLAALGEIMDYVSGIWGAHKYGSTGRGILGSIIGGIFCVVFFSSILPGVGAIAGILVGTFAGAFIGEYVSGRDIISSSRAGWGALLGRTAAIGFKIFVIMIMAVIALLKYVKM